jgi:maltose-binding protein MalE
MKNGEYPRPFATISGFSVSAKSAHIAEAADLAVYLGAHLPVAIYAANPGNIPVHADAIKDPSIASDPMLAVWAEQIKHSDMLPSINEMNYIWTPAITAFTKVVHGEGTAEVELPAAVEAILASYPQ